MRPLSAETFMNMRYILSLGGLSVLLVAQASATTWSFDLQPKANQPGYGYSAAGGSVNRIQSTFNTSTQRFRYEVNMGNSDKGTLPDGFWLAMNDGPNPKGIPNELAIMYFDTGVTNDGKAKLTTYAYNGQNGNSSYFDGKPDAGTQAPDKILSSLTNTSWINELTVRNEANGTRTMVIDINAALVNAHKPKYGDSSQWEGVQFDNKVGIWFHQVDGLSASYGNDGFLTNFSFSSQGWVDGENLNAVPEPATMTILALAAMARRRKKQQA